MKKLRTKPVETLSLEEKGFLKRYKKIAPEGIGSGKKDIGKGIV